MHGNVSSSSTDFFHYESAYPFPFNMCYWQYPVQMTTSCWSFCRILSVQHFKFGEKREERSTWCLPVQQEEIQGKAAGCYGCLQYTTYVQESYSYEMLCLFVLYCIVIVIKFCPFRQSKYEIRISCKLTMSCACCSHGVKLNAWMNRWMLHVPSICRQRPRLWTWMTEMII